MERKLLNHCLKCGDIYVGVCVSHLQDVKEFGFRMLLKINAELIQAKWSRLLIYWAVGTSGAQLVMNIISWAYLKCFSWGKKQNQISGSLTGTFQLFGEGRFLVLEVG